MYVQSVVAPTSYFYQRAQVFCVLWSKVYYPTAITMTAVFKMVPFVCSVHCSVCICRKCTVQCAKYYRSEQLPMTITCTVKQEKKLLVMKKMCLYFIRKINLDKVYLFHAKLFLMRSAYILMFSNLRYQSIISAYYLGRESGISWLANIHSIQVVLGTNHCTNLIATQITSM